MKLLAVDTALGACSAALLDGDVVLGHALEPMERGHAERLAPMVQELMSRAAIPFDALDRLAVTVGPGTFTGQRVGYAFMRGLRLALGRPLVGITTLAAMARAAMAETDSSAAAVLHDAKRSEVYFTLVTPDQTVVPDRLISFDEALCEIAANTNAIDGRLVLAGTAAIHAVPVLRAQVLDVVLSEIVAPDALWVARLARVAPEPETIPRPLYLRPPDARLPASAISIRQATLADLPNIAALHARCFTQGWDEEFLGRILAHPGGLALVAAGQDILAGFVLVRGAAGEAEILSLGISAELRRRGHGAALIRAACQRAAETGVLEVFLEVSVENAAARALYSRLGFREVGRRTDYYEDAVGAARDALVLRRGLPLADL